MKQISLKKNFLMSAILSLSNAVFSLVTYLYIARVLGPTGSGKVSFGMSLISWFSMFAQLGIPEYGIRACAKVRDNPEKLTKTAHELLMINLLMNAITYAAFFLSVFCIPRLQQEKELYVLMSVTILLSSIGMEWLFKALEQYTYITVRSLICKLAAFAAVFLLIHQEKDYVIYGVLSISAASASNILNLFYARKFIQFHPVGKYNLQQHIKPILVFFAMACATTVYTNMDFLMLGFLKNDTDVGYYNAAIRVKTMLVSLINSVGAVLLPRASYYIHQGWTNAFHRISKRAIHFILLASLPCFLYFTLYADAVILVLSGSEYVPAILPMRFLMPTLILIGLTNIMGMEILIPTDREKLVLYSVVIGAMVDVGMNLLLIPRYSAVGTAIGTLLAETAVLLVQLFFLRKEVRPLFSSIPYLKILAALIGATALSYWGVTLHLPSILTVVITGGLFFGAYGGALLLLREPLVCELANDLLLRLKKHQ